MGENKRPKFTPSFDVSAWGNTSSDCDWPKINESLQDSRRKTSNAAETHVENLMFDSNVRVLYSSAEAWKLFFEYNPKVVAVECTGFGRSLRLKGYPLMVQIASADVVIIEFPGDDSISDTPSLSDDLLRVLNDEKIAKVFADPGDDDTFIDSLDTDVTAPINLFAMARDLIGNPSQKENMFDFDVKNIYSVCTKNKRYVDSTQQYAGIIGNFKSSGAMRNQKGFVNHCAANTWISLKCFHHLEPLVPS